MLLLLWRAFFISKVQPVFDFQAATQIFRQSTCAEYLSCSISTFFLLFSDYLIVGFNFIIVFLRHDDFFTCVEILISRYSNFLFLNCCVFVLWIRVTTILLVTVLVMYFTFLSRKFLWYASTFNLMHIAYVIWDDWAQVCMRLWLTAIPLFFQSFLLVDLAITIFGIGGLSLKLLFLFPFLLWFL